VAGESFFVLELCVAACAHLIRLAAELQRVWVRGRIMAMGIMATPTIHLTVLETLRALERLHQERGLAEASIFEKTFARELAKRPPRVPAKKVAGARVVQFAVRAWLAYG